MMQCIYRRSNSTMAETREPRVQAKPSPFRAGGCQSNPHRRPTGCEATPGLPLGSRDALAADCSLDNSEVVQLIKPPPQRSFCRRFRSITNP